MACHSVLGYIIPIDPGLTFIVQLYLYFGVVSFLSYLLTVKVCISNKNNF